MGTGTASADPARLDAAAQAVPNDVRNRLASAAASLHERIATFNGATQSPERLRVNADLVAGGVARAVGTGDELDARLIRTAGAFRAAGSGHPPGFVGPVLPGAMRYMDDAALQATLGGWNTCLAPVAFTQQPDGTYTVTGPDGNEYVMRDGPPPGALPLGSRQDVVDLGNPDFGFELSAAVLIGVTGGSTQTLTRSAPRGAYEHIHLDENGYAVVGPGVTGLSLAPRSMPADASTEPPSRREMPFAAAQLALGGLYEAGRHADARWRNVFRTQTTFYVDPASGERVAVVDAASIRYDNDSNEAIVTSGRLSVVDGRPRLVDPPPQAAPGATQCPPGDQPVIRPNRTQRIPLEEA
jgi:hypothetical protein